MKASQNECRVTFGRFPYRITVFLYVFLMLCLNACHDIRRKSSDSAAPDSIDGSVKGHYQYDSCASGQLSKAYHFHDIFEYDSAIKYYIQSADSFLYSEDWPCLIMSLFLAGEVQSLQHPKEGEILLKKALDNLTRYLPDRDDIKVHIYMRFGYLYLFSGYPDKSLDYFTRADGLLESIIMPGIEIPAYISFCIGDIYRVYFQNPEEAEKHYRKAADMLKNDTVSHDLYLSKAYYSLGTVRYMMEDYNQAQAFLYKAIDFLNNMERDRRSLLESCYSVLGEIEYSKGNLEKSEQNILQSVEYNRIYSKYKPDLAISYNLLGEVAAESGEYEKAHRYIKKALYNSNDSLPISRKNYAASLLILAKMFYRNHDPVNAMTYLDQVYEMTLRVPDFDIKVTGDLYRLKGEIYVYHKQYEDALQNFFQSIWADSYQKKVDSPCLPPSSSIINTCRTAEVAALAGSTYLKRFKESVYKNYADLDSCIACCLFADTLLIKSRGEMVDRESKLYFLEKTRGNYDVGLEAVWCLPENKSSKRNALALYFMERNKSVIMQETLMKSRTLNVEKITRELDQADRNLRLQLAYARKALGEEQKKTDHDPLRFSYYESRIAAIGMMLDSIDQLYHKKFTSFSNFHFVGEISPLKKLISILKSDDLLVEYFWGYSDVYALCLANSGVRFVRLGSSDSLRQVVNNYYQLLSSPDSIYLKANEVYHYQTLASEAYQLLLAPIIGKATKKTKNIIIIPDGPISDIPFEALVAGDDSALNDFSGLSYLLHRYCFSYHFSANLWAHPSKNQRKLSRANKLVLFSPEYRDAFSMPHKEEWVTTKLFRTNLVRGKHATPLSFIEKAPGADIIHLIVHGQTNEKDQDEIVLLMQNDTLYKQGYLTMDIITSVRLHAWLAVLAACNTGEGRYYYGDGIQSISRAFMAAGCGSVIVSPDRITETAIEKIISGFYSNVAKSKNLSLSLACAKRNYLAASDNILSHPAFWSNIRLWGNRKNPIINLSRLVIPGFLLLAISIIAVMIRKKLQDCG